MGWLCAGEQENIDYGPGHTSFVLWDLQTNRELWSLNKNSVIHTEPAWSPDGKWLAVVAMDDAEDNFDRFQLFLVDRDGRVAQQWIDLRGGKGIGAGELKWSPDGRYLALGGNPLTVLDTSTRQLVDYCIHFTMDFLYYNYLYWSPNSKQLVFHPYEKPVTVIDVERNLSSQVVENVIWNPIGWLTLP